MVNEEDKKAKFILRIVGLLMFALAIYRLNHAAMEERKKHEILTSTHFKHSVYSEEEIRENRKRKEEEERNYVEVPKITIPKSKGTVLKIPVRPGPVDERHVIKT